MHTKFAVAAALVIVCAGCGQKKEKPVVLSDYKDKLSYSIGLNIGENLKHDSIDVTMDAFVQGIRDGLQDSSMKLLSPQDRAAIKKAFDQEMMRRQAAAVTALAVRNKAEGEAFLKTNATKPGIVVLPSGLQYEVVTEGKGKMPKLGQSVRVNSIGSLINGKQFDNTLLHGGPAMLRLPGPCKGLNEALQRMRVGSEWKLYIPPDLAFGEQGTNGVGPNATIIIDVELVGIQ